ncbi:hypothetical protein N7470_002030 [Penicillium chermesinum]|nr:hypothetical protein N7470_002030 [Penicillium chermesinum]
MLLFAIFAGSALFWTLPLLDLLKATREEAKAAFLAYSRISETILDHPARLITPSTTAIVAAGTLAHLYMNTDGFPVKVHLLRHRCLIMARELQIHRLDTFKAREERRIKGCDMIDVEVCRRAWWSMVASDWLLSFSGGSQEGAYTFQPRQMNVNLPSNTDDEYITTEGVQKEFPLTVPTSMSGFIFRVKGADLCREVIDALPSVPLDVQESSYDTVLKLDSLFQAAFDNLPPYFKLDPESIEQSKQICKEKPFISYQRLQIHFSLHSRLCRLHRPFHIESITNPKYAYSHMVIIRSAHKVLELRRAMDDVNIDFKAARFGVVMNHVFSAAQKEKVYAAYRTLERSKEESSYLMAGVQKNLQTLMSTFQPVSSTSLEAGRPVSEIAQSLSGALDEGLATAPPSSLVTEGGYLVNDLGQEGWEKLWSEFVAVAPDLDAPQWNSLLDDVEFIL